MSLPAQAKQSIGVETQSGIFVAEFIIGPAEGRTRWILAMTAETP
jgi:hypothetical protein